MDKAWKILEIDLIIEKIKNNLKTKKGLEILNLLKPSNDFSYITNELNKFNELDKYEEMFGVLPISTNIDLDELIKKINQGAVLVEEDLMVIREDILSTIDLERFIFKHNYQFIYLKENIEKIKPSLILLNDINKIIGKDGEILDEASPNLKNIRRNKSRIQGEIKKKMSSYITTYSQFLESDKVHLRDGGYCLAVNSSYKNSIKGIVKDVSDSKLTTFIEPFEIVELQNEFHCLEIEERNEINKILRVFTLEFEDNFESYKATNDSIGELDFIEAKIKFKKENNANIIFPSKKKIINLLEAKHPLIDKNVVISNDFSLNESNIMMIISGPNAGGKTVALKTIAILCYMIKLGLPLTASKDSEVTLFNHIYLDIGDSQSLESNLSTFSAHISSLSYIFNHCNCNDLVLIDEIGNGTDPKEGESLAVAIAKFLLKKKCFSILTSHYDLVKKFAYEHEEVINASFMFNERKITSTYKMLTGIGGKSYGFLIAKKYGISADIVSDAISIYNQNYLTKEEVKIKKVESKEIKLKEYEKELKDRENILSEKEKEIEKLKKELQLKEQKLKDKKLDELDQYLDSKYDEINSIYDDFIKNKNIKDATNKLENVIKVENNEEFKVGNNVFIKSLNCRGKIMSINKDTLVVSLENGFKSKISKDKVFLVQGEKKTLKSTRNIDDEIFNIKPVSFSINLIGYHIDEAIDALSKYLDDCSIRKYKEVKVIHGYGTGKLREAIHNYLKTSRYVKSFKLGGIDGGSGATIVTLK